MRRACLSLMALLVGQAAWAAPPETIPRTVPLDPVTGETPTVVVEAPEPLYVAPTLRDRIGRIWAPVLINGKGPFRLVLDTGANSSAIIPPVLEALGVGVEGARTVQLTGVTGTAVVPVIFAQQLEVGDLLMQNIRLPVVPDVFGGAQGVLGSDGLGDKRIYIDFRNDLIRISRSHGEPLPVNFTRVPVTLNSLRLLTFDLRVGNVRTHAILDTGAQQSMGNGKLREALLRRAREARDEDIVGVTLDVAQGQSMAIPPIGLGDIQVRNMRVNFGNEFIFERWKLTREPALILGMDVIGTLETLIIDYKQRELHLRAPRR